MTLLLIRWNFLWYLFILFYDQLKFSQYKQCEIILQLSINEIDYNIWDIIQDCQNQTIYKNLLGNSTQFRKEYCLTKLNGLQTEKLCLKLEQIICSIAHRYWAITIIIKFKVFWAMNPTNSKYTISIIVIALFKTPFFI